ncbi:hypothetical protein FRC04_001544 [Tulasnella sp. 424]|nr:hypothetical protein FRC04_001544 [Tulasnella sp. 424]KAG8969087.1 hypothetical protein FRC05_001240 [Tulasnella sp. 425]
MKLSTSFAVVSFLAAQILLAGARPFGEAEGYTARGSLRARQNNSRQQGNNQNGGNRFGGQNGGNRFGGNRSTTAAAAKTTTTAAAAKTTTTAAAAKTTTTAVAAATTAAANNQNKGNNKGNNGAKTTTTAAAAATTTAAANNGNTGANTGANAGNNGGNLQTSLTLDPKLIGANLAQDGQGGTPEAGQVPSLTSTNNYINFCDGVNQPITNGLQVAGGSCNPVPMGQIPAKQNVPSCKFVFPKNGQTIAANKDFTISLAVKGFVTGNFVNPNTNYFSAPQQLKNGQIIGHGHAVIEKLTSLDQTTPTDPNVFAFFKGLNAAAVNGVLTADVTGGLPAGFYKVSSINTAANHQPVIGPVAQHGSFDDVSYFTVQ